jgi:hypothetical protein
VNRVALFAALTLVTGCTASPLKLPCQTYVVGSFTPENHYALSVETTGWPQLDQPREWIEIGLLAARPVTAPIDLVHVLGTQEVERWKLEPPATAGATVTCRIAPGPEGGCGASIRITPQNMSGYYYLEPNGNALVEAGMSFKLCRPRS